MPWLESLFGFQGRLGRLRFFGLTCLNGITFGLMFLFGLYMIHLHSLTVGGILAVAGFILTTWATLALQWKRLHDLGHSGWYAIGIVLFSDATQIVARYHRLAALIPDLIVLAAGIVLLFARGTAGPNRYGQGPNLLA